jgi:hypothetical protein
VTCRTAGRRKRNDSRTELEKMKAAGLAGAAAQGATAQGTTAQGDDERKPTASDVLETAMKASGAAAARRDDEREEEMTINQLLPDEDERTAPLSVLPGIDGTAHHEALCRRAKGRSST